MTKLPFSLFALLLLCQWACQPTEQAAQEDTPAEDIQTTESEENDWQMLFDGSNTDAWRNYKSQDFKWMVEDGLLTTDGSQGDIITKDTYENFELEFVWKIERGGNSGVIYLVQENEQYGSTYETGPEYQLIDNDNYEEVHDYKLEPSQVTAANYALHVPTSYQLNPAGEFNTSRILVNDGHVEHWINGSKAVEYDLWTPEWESAVAQTKFKEMPDYGKAHSGHIALQGHGDVVWFKNIRIREL